NRVTAMTRLACILPVALLLLGACAPRQPAPAPRPAGNEQRFPDPKAAVDALVNACRTNNEPALVAIFGDEARTLVSSPEAGTKAGPPRDPAASSLPASRNFHLAAQNGKTARGRHAHYARKAAAAPGPRRPPDPPGTSARGAPGLSTCCRKLIARPLTARA